MFDDLVVSSANPKRTNKSVDGGRFRRSFRPLSWACLILIPLIYTEALPKETLTTFLVAPAPPPPPPPPAAAIQRIVKPVVRLIHNGQMMAPTVIPKKVAMIKEEELPPDVGSVGVTGGVPGGIAGGSGGRRSRRNHRWRGLGHAASAEGRSLAHSRGRQRAGGEDAAPDHAGVSSDCEDSAHFRHGDSSRRHRQGRHRFRNCSTSPVRRC